MGEAEREYVRGLEAEVGRLRAELDATLDACRKWESIVNDDLRPTIRFLRAELDEAQLRSIEARIATAKRSRAGGWPWVCERCGYVVTEGHTCEGATDA